MRRLILFKLKMRKSTSRFGNRSESLDGNGRDPGMKELINVEKAAGISVARCKLIAEQVQQEAEQLIQKYQAQ